MFEIQPVKLWSPLRRRLANCGQTVASVDQWIGTIRNLQKSGVSTTEIEWSCIEAYFDSDDRRRRVQLSEVLDALDRRHRPEDLLLADE